MNPPSSPITTHVLDTSRGRPAAGLVVTLAILRDGNQWKELAHGQTDNDGRIKNFLDGNAKLERATYRLTFQTSDYFARTKAAAFYPLVEVVFTVADPSQHHHVPLLLSPFGYSTYRGS